MSMKTILFSNHTPKTMLLTILCVIGVCVQAQNQSSAPSGAGQNQTSAPPNVAQQVGATAAAATQTVQDAGKTALTGLETVWSRIDERRLKNRTPDELVSWALMGLLVAGLLYRFTKGTQGKAVVLGLVGAFLGGIVANVFQLNLGLGPVLIRYEDLICSLIGSVVLLIVWGKVAQKMAPKPDAGAAPKSGSAKKPEPVEAKH
jgi:uncharacterized membrane protein YeaQ/YmgE (transglycosylase-associated protein family)